MQQESSFNPTSLNKSEGAYGLMQWREDRRQALEDFARSRGTAAADPYTQLDFIGHEMQGSEARNAAPFLAAQDLPTANTALRQYIRYGSDTEQSRLNNAKAFYSPGAPADAAQPPVGLLSPQPTQSTPPQLSGGFLGPSLTPALAPPTQTAQAAQQPDVGAALQSQQLGANLGKIGMSLMAPQMQAPPLMAAPRPPVDLNRIQAVLAQQPRPAGWTFRG